MQTISAATPGRHSRVVAGVLPIESPSRRAVVWSGGAGHIGAQQTGSSMQTQNRIFDDIARLFANAAGAAQGLREEVEVLVRGQAERLFAEFDLITREEFEAVRALAAAAREEAEALAARVAMLEAALAAKDNENNESGEAAADGGPAHGDRADPGLESDA
jgi:BMFP domain-containing protein YqiC